MVRIILAFIFFLIWPIAPGQAGMVDGLAAYNKGDFATAVKEWEPLAEQGNPYAQNNLGSLYDRAPGVWRDYAKALKWYKRAAAQGSVMAQTNLGKMFSNGRGVRRDYARAQKWYRLAAKQGAAEAQFQLGLMYGIGQGVGKDFTIAYMWTNIAVVNGSKLAIRARDIIAKKLSKEAKLQALKLSQLCRSSRYNNLY